MIKEKSKYGMELQVGKSDVFTKESLKVLQDKMSPLCIEEFNKEYGLNNVLKTSNDFIGKASSNIIILIINLKRNKEKLFKGKNKSNVDKLPMKEDRSNLLFLEIILHSILTVIKRSKSNMKLIKNIKST